MCKKSRRCCPILGFDISFFLGGCCRKSRCEKRKCHRERCCCQRRRSCC